MLSSKVKGLTVKERCAYKQKLETTQKQIIPWDRRVIIRAAEFTWFSVSWLYYFPWKICT